MEIAAQFEGDEEFLQLSKREKVIRLQLKLSRKLLK
jgi:hypothetical protein